MFLSKPWAVVTSLDTTNAWTGWDSVSPIAAANWFTPPDPIVFILGGFGTGGGLGAAALAPLDPPVAPAIFGAGVDTIFLTVFIPATIAAPAATAPKAGPTIGIPDKDL